MPTAKELEEKRESVLKEMRSLRSLKRGSISKQYLEVPQKGKPPEKRGPYYVFSRREGKRTVSRRLRTEEELE